MGLPAKIEGVVGATLVNKKKPVNLLVHYGQHRKRRVGAPSVKMPELLEVTLVKAESPDTKLGQRYSS